MKRLTKDETTTNVEALLNFAYAADREVKLSYADGEEDITLAEYLGRLAKGRGCDCSLEDILNGDACGCDCGCDCYVNVLNTVAIQAAELRARLQAIEDILGDEYDLERLKHLVTGDTFTEEDMSAAYTSGYETGIKATCDPCPAILAIKSISGSDLQPVVRCKDCVHRGERQRCDGRRPDYYCADGVRRRNDGK